MSMLQFIPLSPTTTLRRSERFALLPEGQEREEATDEGDSESAEARARVEYLNQVLLEEDTGICESVQRGVQSRAFTQGRLMVSKGGCGEQKWHTEIAVAHFHQLLRRYTGEKD